MVSEAKLCLLFQPQRGNYDLLSRSYLKYHYEYRNVSFSSPCTDHFNNDETSRGRFEAHIYRSTLLWSKCSALSVRQHSRLWLSYSLSNSQVFTFTLSHRQPPCSSVITRHNLDPPPPPTWVRTASLRPLHQQLWREHFLTHTDGVRMQKTDRSEH